LIGEIVPQPRPIPLDQVDLTDLDAFARNGGWAMFDTLRAEDPVHWTPEVPPNSGFWAVTKHADIDAVDRDPETFTSTKYVNLEEVDDDLMDLRRSMLETDGLRHRALRKLIQREFSQGPLARKYEEFLRGLTKVTVDNALQNSEFDFVEKVSADFPINVLVRLLDVPVSDTGMLINWGNQMIGNTDPDYSEHLITDPDSDQYKHLPFRSPAALEVFEYGRELARRRKGGNGTDLISTLVNKIPEDGQPLSASDFDNYFLLLVIAGNETTRHAISQSMLALIENQDQLKLLQEQPELIPGAVEEFLRWASPVYHFRRTATRHVELGGKQIRADDKVVMWFASGNRDEAVFDDPYRFDVTRTNIDHVTFGKGSPHMCLGSALARMEIRLMFTELIPRLVSIELNGEVKRVRSNFINGIKKFPVRVEAN
jgi:cytochrome P450